MEIMGTNTPHFSVPVCNKFKRIVLEGRLCYQVDVNEFKDQVDTKKLRIHGLVFLMDYNEDRLGLDTSTDLETSADRDFLHHRDDKKKDAMIYFQTLGMHKHILYQYIFKIVVLIQSQRQCMERETIH